jgi:hypothetical protein
MPATTANHWAPQLFTSTTALSRTFTLGGDGLCVGYDSGDNVSQQYSRPGTFTGGTILGVAVDVSDESYLDMEREAAGAFARD